MSESRLEEMLKGFISALLIKFRNDLTGVKHHPGHIEQNREIYKKDKTIKNYTDKSVEGLLFIFKTFIKH